MMRAAWLVVVAAWTPPAWGQEADIREIQLTDGRVVVGPVLATEPAGIRVQVAQGEVIVGFHQLKGVKPSSPSAAANQRPWEIVVIGAEADRRWLERVVRTYPALVVAGDGAYPSPLPLASVSAARACAPVDLGCAVQAAQRAGAWSWLVSVEPTGAAPGAVLRARTSLGSEAGQVKVANLQDPREVTAALDRLLGLAAVPGRDAAIVTLTGVLASNQGSKPVKPPKGGGSDREPKPATAPDDGPPAPTPLAVLVPLPGYPALRSGDTKTFGLALATSVPAAAAWVGLTGAESRSLPEHLALSAGGWWLTSIVANQVSSGRASVAVGPGRDGGWEIRVAGGF